MGYEDLKHTIFGTVDPKRKGTASEKVNLQLRKMIHSGELRPGDRLPSERDLAKRFGVSRPTLRLELKSLAAVGALQPRRGAGTFISRIDESPSLNSIPLRQMAISHGLTAGEMLEASRSIGIAIAELAAERATSDHLAIISDEVTGMYASLDDPEQFLLHDVRFHQAVAAAAGNRILTSLMNMVATIVFDMRRKTNNRAQDLKELASMRRQIYRAIRERSAESARKAMMREVT